MKTARKFITFAFLFGIAAALLATPKRKEPKVCQYCQSQNEDWRTSCRNCWRRF